MRINHNISAMQTNSQLRKTNKNLDTALERLSSGYRINRAADDAAGMAISRKMKTQIEGLERASMNSSDGISVIQTAEGALNEVTAMLQRMRQLAVQAANGTNTNEDRLSIQQELNQLTAEIARISETTEFNTKTLLDGNIDNNSYSNVPGLELIYASDTVASVEYEMTLTCDPRQAVIVAGEPSITEIGEEEVGTITINGYSVYLREGQSLEDAFASIRNLCDSMNIKAFFGDAGSTDGPAETAGYEETDIGDGSLIFMSRAYGSSQKISIQCNNPVLAEALGLSTNTVTAYGVDAKIELGEGFSPTATVSARGDIVYVRDSNNFEMRYQITPGTVETDFTDATGDGEVEQYCADDGDVEAISTLLSAGPMYLQVGANEDQTMQVRIPRTDPVTLGIASINVCTQEGAEAAITLYDNAVNEVSAIRAKLGAYQNRLDHTITNLDVTGLNMTESMSRIEDVDMAEEMTVYTQQSVLDQAGTAMLAQANQRPQNILSLLNG
ncbi:MAG: flagellar biosynthesis protein FlgL [Lachnospiraceae bacterium]|nr:flagellar biosynthesis protein FlgL [Lachnospiraceae bacterium]MBQ6090475.1 flagellar biosynthesis protein FlgL [Lachnospiraceae bacterium]